MRMPLCISQQTLLVVHAHTVRLSRRMESMVSVPPSHQTATGRWNGARISLARWSTRGLAAEATPTAALGGPADQAAFAPAQISMIWLVMLAWR